MRIDRALKEARGRTVVIGEDHADRKCCATVLAAVAAARAFGYCRLGVEAAKEGAFWIAENHYCSGLQEEIECVRRQGEKKFSEYDPHTSLGPWRGKNYRMNRYWYIQKALLYGWDVRAIDPNHWNWMQEGEHGYFLSRDPIMAECILSGSPMIAVVGAAHLKGLHDHIGSRALLLNTCEVSENDEPEMGWEALGRDRYEFIQRVPFLTTQ